MTRLSELTSRQREVAELIAHAQTTKQIAATLGISPRRVRVIVSSIAFLIRASPDCDERIQVAMWFLEENARQAA